MVCWIDSGNPEEKAPALGLSFFEGQDGDCLPRMRVLCFSSLESEKSSIVFSINRYLLSAPGPVLGTGILQWTRQTKYFPS